MFRSGKTIFLILSSTTLDQSKKAELGGEVHGFCSTDLRPSESWGHATIPHGLFRRH